MTAKEILNKQKWIYFALVTLRIMKGANHCEILVFWGISNGFLFS